MISVEAYTEYYADNALMYRSAIEGIIGRKLIVND